MFRVNTSVSVDPKKVVGGDEDLALGKQRGSRFQVKNVDNGGLKLTCGLEERSFVGFLVRGTALRRRMARRAQRDSADFMRPV